MITLYEGDNLKILKEKIKDNSINIVYLDPPYNTKAKNLTYNDTFKTSDWKKEFKERLLIIKQKLMTNSVIYVSIGKEELINAKISLDEIFGLKNFISIMPRQTTSGHKTSLTVANLNDFLLVYKQGVVSFKTNEILENNYKLKDEHYNERGPYQLRRLDYKEFKYSEKQDFPIVFNENNFYAGNVDKKEWEIRQKTPLEKDWCWLWSEERIKFAIENNFIVIKENKVWKKTYLNINVVKIKNEYNIIKEKKTKPITSLSLANSIYSNSKNKNKYEKMFFYPKSKEMLKEIFKWPTFNEKKILDLYGGSGATGVVANEMNLKAFIIQNSEKTKKNSEAYKEGFETIFDLTEKILFEYVKKDNLTIEREKNGKNRC